MARNENCRSIEAALPVAVTDKIHRQVAFCATISSRSLFQVDEL
jgi:hypothetical protein